MKKDIWIQSIKRYLLTEASDIASLLIMQGRMIKFDSLAVSIGEKDYEISCKILIKDNGCEVPEIFH